MSAASAIYKSDCIYFRGDSPCTPHKRFGVHCSDCTHYQHQRGTILIIKLGAAGDVIRTTPLLHALHKHYPDHLIHWISYTPELLPRQVHKPMLFGPEAILIAEQTDYDVVINLDKDAQACALASRVRASVKFGFVLNNGKAAPANELAQHKFLTGLFDDVNKANIKSYPQEIFEICGWTFNREEYILDKPDVQSHAGQFEGRTAVGLNTGCGDRWTSRRWKEEYWVALCGLLVKNGYTPLLLGGLQEHDQNMRIAAASGAEYSGHRPLREFISLVDTCATVVTTVTLALHIAIALKKQVVLINNIFNPHEFELYGRGCILSPTNQCHCFFSGTCTNSEYSCMDSLLPETVFQAIESTRVMHA